MDGSGSPTVVEMGREVHGSLGFSDLVKEWGEADMADVGRVNIRLGKKNFGDINSDGQYQRRAASATGTSHQYL